MVARVASIVAFAAVAAASLGQTDALPRVDSGVHRTLRKQSTVNIIVQFKDTIANPHESVKEADYATREAKIAALVAALEMNAAASQAEATKLLSQEASSTTPLYSSSSSLWISNSMSFRDASFELVEKLASLNSIAEIREEKVFYLPEIKAVNTTASAAGANLAATAEWGVQRVKATDIWATGNTGQGIIVGSIDSGVRATHEALKDNMRSSYGWYDPERNAATPYDSNGHGTHTLSTMAGSKGLGVAPGATWMACKGCRGQRCPESDLLACGQWMTCPTDTSGRNRDCSKAPHLVSNSLGGDGNDPSYKSVVAAWHAADIIPIFANGNIDDGIPKCSTAGSPAEYDNVIAVGATDINNKLADFSCLGPTITAQKLVKPDISAPGQDIRGAWSTGDSAYNTISGTSMATPHVSGVIALLLKAKPGLKYADVVSLLTSTTVQSLPALALTCGGTGNGVYPNNQYGWGLINALAAINKSQGGSSPTGAPSPAPTTRAPAPTPAPTLSCWQSSTRAQCLANPSCTWSSFFQFCF